MIRKLLARLFGLDREATAFLGLGSNRGERLDILRSALEDLDADDRTTVEAVSAVYDTEPVLDEGQDARDGRGPREPQERYLNLVACVTTTRDPHGLLDLAHDIERAHGRDRAREGRWGARTLDIDVLLYEDERIRDEDLEVPHPRLTDRAFVLVPLADVMPPGARLPDGTTIAKRLAELAPIEGIELHVRLVEGPGSKADPLNRRPPGPRGGRPRLGERQGGEGLQGPARRHREAGDHRDPGGSGSPRDLR